MRYCTPFRRFCSKVLCRVGIKYTLAFIIIIKTKNDGSVVCGFLSIRSLKMKFAKGVGRNKLGVWD